MTMSNLPSPKDGGSATITRVKASSRICPGALGHNIECLATSHNAAGNAVWMAAENLDSLRDMATPLLVYRMISLFFASDLDWRGVNPHPRPCVSAGRPSLEIVHYMLCVEAIVHSKWLLTVNLCGRCKAREQEQGYPSSEA